MVPVVIPVAGLGTRSLPLSKAIPKEMLPVYDRPIIQHIVEEAIASGVKQVIFVTSQGKSSLEDHFDISVGLEETLKKTNKKELYETIHRLSRMIDIVSVRQKEPRGLGHAVWTARSVVHQTPFAVMLGDDMIDAPQPGLKQLIRFYEEKNLASKKAGVVMLMKVPDEDTSKYGICEMDKNSFQISGCREKPKPSETSSRLGIIGRYLLPQDIFEKLEKQNPGALGEIQLTDGLNLLAREGRLFGCILEGQRFDAGDKLGFLKANVHYYLKSEWAKEVRSMLKEVIQT